MIPLFSCCYERIQRVGATGNNYIKSGNSHVMQGIAYVHLGKKNLAIQQSQRLGDSRYSIKVFLINDFPLKVFFHIIYSDHISPPSSCLNCSPPISYYASFSLFRRNIQIKTQTWIKQRKQTNKKTNQEHYTYIHTYKHKQLEAFKNDALTNPWIRKDFE